MRNWLRFAMVALPLGFAVAQTIEFEPTSRGAFFDARDGSLRPLIGVPGSGIIGNPIATGLEMAWPAPAGRYAIAVKNGATVFFDRQQVSDLSLLASPTQVAWNSTGAVALLYSDSEQTMQCVEPTLAHTPLPLHFLDGPVTAIAVQDCETIAIAKGEHVYLFKEGRIPRIAIETKATALTFSSQALYAATGTALLEHRSGMTKQVAERSGITALAALKTGNLVALSPDKVTILDSSGSGIREIPLEQPAEGVHPLGHSIFLLNRLAADRSSALVLDLSAEPAVFFVPTITQDSL